MPADLRSFYDKCPLGIAVIRRDRKEAAVLYSNPALQVLLGGRIDNDLARLWPHPETDTLIRKLQSNTPPKDYILPVGTSYDPQQRWVKLTIAQDIFEDEKAFILWVTDISASKEAESRLQQAVADADAAAEMKSNFLATMSHEIRTPMQSVYGLLELINEEKPEQRIRDMVDVARGSASDLLEILDDILDVAKMDADKMELDTFEVPVRTLVRGINEALAVKVHGNAVALLDDIAPEVPFVVIGDPKRLRQIIMNLTGNALKFTKKGSVTIRVVRGTPTATHPLTLRFEVVDTGIGMSPEARARMFQPFMQADNTTARKFGGTGLGLSICKKLVELMGGSIGVDSVEGQGSTFWFEIPTEEVSTDTTSITLPDLDGISVLSVEDHPQGAKEIVRSLQSMGATVESCSTCAEALEIVRSRPFDVGVIDQGLPDGLGIDLIRNIMQVRPFMGLIMYTVRDDIGLQYGLNSLGVSYLAKPASRRGLGESVQDAAKKTTHMNSQGPQRLLIAEDTASVRDILRRQLEKLGVAADFATNGAEALTMMSTGLYGILFSDLHMPEVDGYEVVSRTRAAEKGTGKRMPIIALTADVQMSDRQTYQGYGFDECLLKPVSIGHLRRLLMRWGLLAETDSEDDTKLFASPAPQKTDESPALDIEKIKQQMGAFDDGIIEMLHMFIDMTAPLIAQITAAASQKDYQVMHEAAHSLKGAARSACCNVLGDKADALQEESGRHGADCDALAAAIVYEFDRAAASIRALKVKA